MFGWWDPMYFLFVAPGFLLAMYASFKVKSTFARQARSPRAGWTGRDVAQAILNSEGIQDVAIEPVNSYLGDHYDPQHKVLRLSPDVYHGRSWLLPCCCPRGGPRDTACSWLCGAVAAEQHRPGGEHRVEPQFHSADNRA